MGLHRCKRAGSPPSSSSSSLPWTASRPGKCTAMLGDEVPINRPQDMKTRGEPKNIEGFFRDWVGGKTFLIFVNFKSCVLGVMPYGREKLATGRPSWRRPRSTRQRQDVNIGKLCPLPLCTLIVNFLIYCTLFLLSLSCRTGSATFGSTGSQEKHINRIPWRFRDNLMKMMFLGFLFGGLARSLGVQSPAFFLLIKTGFFLGFWPPGIA